MLGSCVTPLEKRASLRCVFRQNRSVRFTWRFVPKSLELFYGGSGGAECS